ncbi:hypothetical protein PNEG_01581 [Pneumocystis murina B123]|uniref:Cytoplasmic tRNA 2-thiolation protein 2 n=1 Tax=Pneumocystis murina (strain B123) TaxID=1069680 RepID=M7P917_PNEMU|nr:hypothetical protein PNEG_01581 [Pneumocystis murina B123]EMR10325.1 hypothetical protein PNEG_01581 [Pneumocystis murina B123]
MGCENGCNKVKKYTEDTYCELSNICGRCKEKESSFFSKSEAFCSQCFIIYIKRKFHKTLESFFKEDISFKNNKALIAVSEGTSLALIKFFSENSDKFKFKRYFNILDFIHIEEDGSVKEVSNSSYISEKINEMLPESLFFLINLKNYILNSDENIKLFWDKMSDALLGSQISKESVGSLNDLLSPLSSTTSRMDILKCIRNNIIYNFAEKNGYNVIIFGDTISSIASKIISETAKGRGYSIPWETRGKIKQHLYDIWLLRPMKDILRQEAYYFLEINGIQNIKKFYHKATTIDELVDRYFDDLEKNNPSFLFTVAKTSAKLQVPEIKDTKEYSNSEFCFICQMPKENNVNDWLKKIALDKNDLSNVTNTEINENYENYLNRTKDVCYGCFIMLRGSKSEFILPYFEKGNINSIRNPKDEVLSEYLID